MQNPYISKNAAKQAIFPVMPTHYSRDGAPGNAGDTGADRHVWTSPSRILLDIGGEMYKLSTQQTLDLDIADNWDDVSGTDWTDAANRAGKDFYVYACQPTSGSVLDLILSANASIPDAMPSGETPTADNTRKISGFHCLCEDVGTISGHALTDYVQGDILPASVWDVLHRPVSSPAGMAYDDRQDLWVDIYLTSGTGDLTASANDATISDDRNWMDFVDDLGAVNKRLMDDHEFQLAARGSNEETNIDGSSDPVVTGGYIDEDGRRMISEIGLEGMCGQLHQWLLTQGYRADDFTHSHTVDTTTSNEEEPTTTDEAAPGYGWYNLPGSQGSIYRQGGYGDVKLRAGGTWHDGSYCGPRCRAAHYGRWITPTTLGGRGCARSQRA